MADLSSEQLEQIIQLVTPDNHVDWNKERQVFLEDCKSLYTRRAYDSALQRFESWANQEEINPLNMSAANADHFIRFLKREGRAPSSIRIDIAAVSAFYTWLERYYKTIRNPIRGTRIRPPNETKKGAEIPDLNELKLILAAMPPVERAIIKTMAFRGLRAGALPTLCKRGERYIGKSKGKSLKEGPVEGITLPPDVIKTIENAGLNINQPFALMSVDAIKCRIWYRISKLYQAGEIRAPYSCHDFRHFFAVQEYKKDKDILRVSRLLNHAGIEITQTYLQSISVEL